MIKVVFTYSTQTKYLSQLMKKLELSADPKFNSDINNLGINLFKREEEQNTFIVLDIYYNSLEDYKIRTSFERSQDDWNDIWFNPNINHKEVSIEIFDVLNKSI